VVDGSSAVWFGAGNFRVLDVVDDGNELTISLESAVTVTGCATCGTRARAKDRRWVALRDAPAGDRAVVLRVWRRIWVCPDPDCEARTWTESCELAEPRRVLTNRAVMWATDRIAAIEGTVASIARGFGVSWPTVWTAVEREGAARVEDPDRVGETPMVGFDETVMQPAHRRRRRRFITAVVDVTDGQIIDVFEGRDAAHLELWLEEMPASWRDAVQVVSVDPHEGYRSALTDTTLLGDVALVVDPFHIVRLANMAVTRCRQRIQQDTLGHRGWARDPLYASRKLFLLGAERVDDAGWARIWGTLAAGDPDGELQDTWVAKEKVRDIYLTDDPAEARVALDDAIAWCTAPEAGPEQRRLAKTLRRWHAQILAHHTTGASNGPVEAANLLIKQVKRSGRGFRNMTNYRLRILLAGGLTREHHPVTRLRARPSSVA
jgi:transposase